jgi:lysophospholipase L1-like esterase
MLKRSTWVGLGLLGAWLMAHGQPVTSTRATTQTVASRWQSSLDDFAASDRLKAPPAGGVLFVGSSSIRLWDGLETGFGDPTTIIKRGFGGSRLSDCASLIDKLVTPYQPRMVVVYAGDNDLAEGAQPEEVAAQFERFVTGVREALPQTRVAYVSIKPSPARAHLLPRVQATNALILAYTERTDNTDFIDIYTPMLGTDGLARKELFSGDSLHLNASGYALWRQVIAKHLAPYAPPATASGDKGSTGTVSTAVSTLQVKPAAHASTPADAKARD